MLRFLWCVLLSLSIASANATIIPAERVTPTRSQVGVLGGIPVRAVGVTATSAPYSANSTGTADATAAIQAAINATPNGQAVYLPAGNYTIGGILQLKQGTTLKGSGRNSTLVKLDGRIEITGGGPLSIYSWTGGYSKGATSITVSSASGLSVGQYVGLDQLNDTSFVNPTGSEGYYSASGRTGTNPYLGSPRAMVQMVQITSISGTTLGIDPPLLIEHKASLTPELFTFGAPKTYVGIEDIGFECAGSGADWQIDFTWTANCWVKDCEFNLPNRAAVLNRYSMRNEVRDSYVHNSRVKGSTAYGIELLTASSCLIENNVLKHLVAGVMTGSAAGNAICYNYATDLYDGFLSGSGFQHAVHCYMNVWEGNEFPSFYFDQIHGSASDTTLNRNHSAGYWPGSDSNMRPISIEAWNRRYSVIGCVLGTVGKQTIYEASEGVAWAPSSIYFLGWKNVNSDSPSDSQTVSTLLRHGNWDTLTGLRWDPTISDHTLPASLIYSSKPSWWDAWGTAAWPPIGPDLSPMVSKLPAQLRFEGAASVTYPNTPTITAPTASATGVSKTPTFTLSAYYDGTGAAQTDTQFTVKLNGAVAWDSGSLGVTTTTTVAAGALSYGTTYTVSGRYKSAVGWSSYSPEVTFTTLSTVLPGTPTNVSPAANAVNQSLQPTLTISGYSDGNSPSSSQVYVNFKIYAADGVTLVHDSGNLSPATSYAVPAGVLAYASTNKWSARVYNALGLWSAMSAQTSFSTTNAPVIITVPSTPSNSAPSNGATGVSLTPTLTLSAYSDPNTPTLAQTGAQFLVYANDGITLIWDSGQLPAVSSVAVTATYLNYATAYKLTGRHKNSAGWSGFSSQTGFTVTNAPALSAPNTPTMASPASGATGVSLTPTLTLSAYSDPQGSGQSASQFRVYASNGTTLIHDSGVRGSVNYYAVPTAAALQYTTVYRVQGRMRSQNNLWSDWSTLSALTTLDAPAQPEIVQTNGITLLRFNGPFTLQVFRTAK